MNAAISMLPKGSGNKLNTNRNSYQTKENDIDQAGKMTSVVSGTV